MIEFRFKFNFIWLGRLCLDEGRFRKCVLGKYGVLLRGVKKVILISECDPRMLHDCPGCGLKSDYSICIVEAVNGKVSSCDRGWACVNCDNVAQKFDGKLWLPKFPTRVEHDTAYLSSVVTFKTITSVSDYLARLFKFVPLVEETGVVEIGYYCRACFKTELVPGKCLCRRIRNRLRWIFKISAKILPIELRFIIYDLIVRVYAHAEIS